MTSGPIRVRAFRETDIEPLHEAVSESIAEVAPFETWCHPDFSLAEAEEYVRWWIKARARRHAFYYAVEDAAASRFLGACGVSGYSSEHRHAMLGYWVRTSETRKDVATTAARLVVAAAFADLDLLRVSIGVPVANIASHRVAEKLGAAREGVMRQELVLPNAPSDVVFYSLLPGELRAARARTDEVSHRAHEAASGLPQATLPAETERPSWPQHALLVSRRSRN